MCQEQCHHYGTPLSYSHDLTSRFLPVPKLKMKSEGNRFADSVEGIENATRQLKTLSENAFQECFEHLYERWNKRINAGGEYFEVY